MGMVNERRLAIEVALILTIIYMGLNSEDLKELEVHFGSSN